MVNSATWGLRMSLEHETQSVAPPEGRHDAITKAVRLVAWVLAIPAIAIAYYFAIALPAFNEARLQLERQQHADDLRRSEAAARDAEGRKEMLEACLQKASEDYFNYLKLNGTVSKDGKISAPQSVAMVADKRKNDDRDACFKQYGEH